MCGPRQARLLCVWPAGGGQTPYHLKRKEKWLCHCDAMLLQYFGLQAVASDGIYCYMSLLHVIVTCQ